MCPRARSIALLIAASVGCRGGDEVATPTPTPEPPIVTQPEPTLTSTAAPTDARACGEAGPTPTSLPPTLARGMLPVGEGVLRAGESRTVGTVQVKYDPNLWIGTMEVGGRVPAIAVVIDRGEADGGPWGGHEELRADRSAQMHVGPYRIDWRTSGGDPVESVTFTVARDACPASATIERAERPVWLWVSTEAIRGHTYDMRGPLLQVVLFADGPRPRLQVSQLGYMQHLTPRPGESPSFRLGDRRVTIEEVVPGPGTRHEGGAWISDGDARVHARVRIEPAPPSVVAEAVAPTDACGAASPRRTRVPDALRVPPRLRGEVTLAPGERRRLGAHELELTTTVLPGRGRRDATTYHTLMVHAKAPVHSMSLGPQFRPQLGRLGDRLLRLDPGGAGRLRVRELAVACGEEASAPAATAPIHAWLSSVGHARLTVGAADAPALRAQLYVDVDGASLIVSDEHGHLSRALRPADVGQPFTIAGSLVEIVDLVPGEGTTLQSDRWVSDGPAPVVHVQLRISPDV